jgi:hypothetical protein
MLNLPLIDPLSWTNGSLDANIYLVKKGVRPVAEIIVHKRYLKILMWQIKKANIFHINHICGKNHIAIYLFSHKYLKDVINFTYGKSYNKSNVIFWINGKIFGYSEHEISKYIHANNNRGRRKLLILKEKKCY